MRSSAFTLSVARERLWLLLVVNRSGWWAAPADLRLDAREAIWVGKLVAEEILEVRVAEPVDRNLKEARNAGR